MLLFWMSFRSNRYWSSSTRPRLNSPRPPVKLTWYDRHNRPKAPEGVEAKRSAVDFPHARHFDIACITCHHTWGLTEPIAGCMTSGCHDVTEISKPKPGERRDDEAGIAYFKAAYHKLCINCHKENKVKSLALQKALKTLNKPVPKTGPTSCSECHPK